MGSIRIRRPMVTVSAAIALIGCAGPDQVLALIESGKISFAWNLAIKDAVGVRREIRLLSQGLVDYLTGSQSVFTDDQAFEAIFPEPSPTIRAADIARTWIVSPDHVLNLCRAGQLALMDGSAIRRGPRGTPSLLAGSVQQFMERRRL